ncbi:MAG: N-6 DNA methylase, partial [Polyangia bacterium]|nr:N-6 DNA methylase [Polyangia bacterium]
MSTAEVYFHETWLGMVQPIEGLVVSLPVLVDAQCMERQPPATQQKLLELLVPLGGEAAAGTPERLERPVCPDLADSPEEEVTLAVRDLGELLDGLLELTPALFDAGDALPEDLALYVHEGGQTLRPTLGLRKLDASATPPSETNGVSDTGPTDDSTPASRAGARYDALIWDLPAGLDLDKPETQTGAWEYPPTAKLDRLLRHCRVPIGILTNRTEVRLLYAPHGESSGWLTFRVTDMATVGGRPILDAFIMLLSATRFFGVAEERSLPALLRESRKRQANVTSDLADQVFEALQILLAGFEAAAERDGRHLLDDALARDEDGLGAQDHDHLYQGLLTVLLRLVFTLYAEDRSLLPVDHPIYARGMSALGLYEQLQEDHGAFPDSMSRRFGAWSRLVALFRAIYLGVDHGDPSAGGLSMPPRRGDLFNPQRFPFLEGWGPVGGAPITQAEDRAAVHVPTLDDLTVFGVLEKLLVFQGQRLSYRTLDVEQIGSVYEALMGYHVIRVPAPAVCLRPNRVWVTAEELLDLPASQRAGWLKETAGLSATQADSLAKTARQAEKAADPTAVIYEALSELSVAGRKKDRSLALAQAGRLVVQPGEERRRTSSHYTPRSLSAPIVARTLEPLLATMGDAPPSERILDLKICDPAMGSGAFLVEACRYLADHLVAAWTREGKLEQVAASLGHGDPVMHARRLVAQRCLYGVDKNASAVTLAKLSLWLVTLARDLPFTFLDHSLRHGDSLVGLSFDQIKSFHWVPAKPGQQLELCRKELEAALDEAIALRQQIVDLAHQLGPVVQREKERLLFDAEDALERVRLIGDLIVGAYFAETKDKAREAERQRRLDRVLTWLAEGGPAPDDLVALRDELRARLPPFHWMVEYPEIFYLERPDPLEKGALNHAAFMDAFVGNPPFAGKNKLAATHEPAYPDWLHTIHGGS